MGLISRGSDRELPKVDELKTACWRSASIGLFLPGGCITARRCGPRGSVPFFRRTIIPSLIFRKRGFRLAGLRRWFYLQETSLSEGLLGSGNGRAVEMADVVKGRGIEGNQRPLSIYIVLSSGLAGVLFGHGLHGHGADEVHRLAEVRLEEQVDVGELIDGETRLDGDGDSICGLGHVVAAQELGA